MVSVVAGHAADLTWTNLGGGNWSVTANWSPNQVPASGDNVFITNSGTYSVTLNVSLTLNTLVLGGESGTQVLTNSGSSLTLTNVGSVGPNGVLGMGGGTLAGGGSLTINGTFIWAGGTLTGTGARTIAPGGNLTISGSAAKVITSSAKLVNMAQATWSGGSISVGLGSVISNAPSGIFEMTADVSFVDAAGVHTTLNAGLWRKTGGSGTATLVDPFHNSGTVDVQSGTLRLTGGGTSSGSHVISAGAVFDFGGGTHDLNIGSSLSVTGTLAVSAGIVNLAGGFAGPGTVVLAGGELRPTTATEITLASLVVGGGTLAGTSPVFVTASTTWTNGGFNGLGLTHFNGGLLISGAAAKTIRGRTLVNLAQATWSQGDLNVGNSAGSVSVISNAPGATFDITADVSFIDGSGGITTVNAGILRKTGGTGVTTLNDTFNNSGVVEIQSGMLQLANPSSGTHTGDFIVSAGATLEYAGADHTLTNGGSINGSSLVINSGSLAVNAGGEVVVSNLAVNGGTMSGPGPVTANGLMTWTDGTLTGTGSTHANGGLFISGVATKNLNARTLINTAQAVWSEGNIAIGFGSVLSNAPGATFDLTGDVSFGDLTQAGTTLNAGLWRKSGGSGTSLLRDAFINSGTVDIQSGFINFPGTFTQTAGQTLLRGGNITNTSPLRIHGGILAGTNVIAGSVTNSATVSPGASPGQLIITGNYTETTNASLVIEIAGTQPGTQHDQLIIGGTARLAGRLALTNTGAFLPTTNDLFTILTTTNRIGSFANVVVTPSVYTSQVSYAPTQVVVSLIPPALGIAPTVANVVAGESQAFAAVGGLAPFAFSLATNNSGATINPTIGLYTAGSISNVQDTVRVTDSLGSEAAASVTVIPPPPPIIVLSGQVRDGANAPITNAEVNVVAAGGEFLARLFSDSTGTYSLELPKFGDFTVFATHPQYTLAPPSVTLSNLAANQVVNFTGTRIDPRVSGTVRNAVGTGLASVSLSLRRPDGRSTRGLTAANGGYQFTNLIAGSVYVLTPSSASFRFEPPSIQFTASTGTETANFTGFLAATISGRITNSVGTGMVNTVVFIEDLASGTNVTSTTTLSSGDFVSSLLSTGRTYRVRPSLPGVVFSPATRTVGPLSANVTAVDFIGTNSLFSISGLITNSSGFRLNSGTVQVTGSTNRSSAVNVAGNYGVVGLASLQSYTVTPSRSNFIFAPPQFVIPSLTSNITLNFASSPPYPLPGRIAFRNGMALHVMNADATDAVMLGGNFFPLSGSPVLYRPAYSPDGTRIAYTENTAGGTGIFLINAGGGPVTLLTGPNESARDPAWSPDGKLLAYSLFSSSQGRMPGLWIRDTIAGAEFRIPNTFATDHQPDFSNDAQSVLFVGEFLPGSQPGIPDISSIHTNGTDRLPVVPDVGTLAGPKWSPGGDRLLYLRFASGAQEVFCFEPLNSSTTRLTTNNIADWNADWSPDGGLVVFETGEGGQRKIAVMRPDGSAKTILATGTSPTWSVTPTVATPAGSPVTVTSAVASLTFSNVTASGSTTVLPVPGNLQFVPPPGYFTIPGANMGFEISTTVSNTGPITICFTLPATMSSNAFNLARVLHVENGVAVDRTILSGPNAPNFTNKTICAEVTSLSPFLMTMLADPQLAMIQGVVVDASGQPIPDVVVELEGAETVSLVTGIDGAFAFVNLDPGTNYTIIASHDDNTFSPLLTLLDGLQGTNTVAFVGEVRAEPALNIDRDPSSPGQIRLTWPVSPGGFLLESTTNLAIPWVVAPESPIATNNLLQLTLPADAATRFFRLRKE